MANKNLFSSIKSKLNRADSYNEAGGQAYKFSPKHALAQIAATGCFNGTFYTNAEDQLKEMLRLIDQIDDNVFLAKLAVYARQRAYMKDMPAALLVVLSKRDVELTHQIFGRVVNNGRMLRTTFQMIRSGRFGRTSLSSSLQRAFQNWLNEASVEKLLSASIGNDPSLRDVMRMARPKPRDNARRALYGWLTDRDIDYEDMACPITDYVCHGETVWLPGTFMMDAGRKGMEQVVEAIEKISANRNELA